MGHKKKTPEKIRKPKRLWFIAGFVIALVVVGFFVLRSRRPAEEITEAQPAQTQPQESAVRRVTDTVAPEDLNIILITLDTLRSDRLSCYGSEHVDTPNIDALAREGVRFTNAASTVPFTLPAHSSMMTGTYPPYHGVRENVGAVLGDELPTLAERLGDGGWATAAFVSSFVLDGRWGIDRGFDHYHDNFDLEEFDTPNMSAVQRTGDETVAEAVRWLDQRPAEQPFFLWLHLYDPHEPYTPPEPYNSRYPDRPYDGEVAFTDSLIGDFRQALDERDLLERSLVILTSDHGEGLGDHGEMYHGYYIYESTIHVALIMRPPLTANAGRVVDAPVSHVDLMPTVLNAVALPYPEVVHGRSLVPLMLGAQESRQRGVYSESMYPLLHYGWAPLRSLRTERKKLSSSRTSLPSLGRRSRRTHPPPARRSSSTKKPWPSCRPSVTWRARAGSPSRRRRTFPAPTPRTSWCFTRRSWPRRTRWSSRKRRSTFWRRCSPRTTPSSMRTTCSAGSPATRSGSRTRCRTSSAPWSSIPTTRNR
jgi:arylsulfatase A-like enzyme